MRQLEFDFDDPTANGAGYDNWRAENQARLKRISLEWGVPIEKSVRLSLKNMKGEYHGFLILLEFPRKIDRKRSGPLKLRLNLDNKDFSLGDVSHIDFTSDDIMEWHVLKPQDV